MKSIALPKILVRRLLVNTAILIITFCYANANNGNAKNKAAEPPTLAGKQIVLFGDSWCSGSGDGTGGWGAIIKAEYPTADVVYKSDYGMDWWQGTYFIFPEKEKPKKKWELPEAPDYVLIQAYTNGLYQNAKGEGELMTDGRNSNAAKFGKIDKDKFPTDIESLKALHNNKDTWAYRIEMFLWKMQKTYGGNGKTKLALMFPYRAPKMAGDRNAFNQLKPLVEAFAKKYGYPVLDMYETSIIPYWDSEICDIYMWKKGDGSIDDVHLGLKGNKRITPRITQFLLGL